MTAAFFALALPVLLDKEGEAAQKYEIRPIPSTFFINKDGIIVDGVLGALDQTLLEGKIGNLSIAKMADRTLH
ncbi:redoxin domain-containing protein [Paenibacillus beijingensis]|uniref:Alkyl hydroperoxide reductase subunit C/ Thiol specific antioxidant domain-containing protein n=1 Tax=Paenibacillus beijingensis TaxID=1126833 RepID=A0A0D5NGG6_9BACL|nr:redoxin domain-containing protein [Paenibacillus beijingensis]AJY74205.1 hypothetical protein VN24_05980 [Paenibacillus beijingensis]